MLGGLGTHNIRIFSKDVPTAGTYHTIMPDPIEAGTFGSWSFSCRKSIYQKRSVTFMTSPIKNYRSSALI